MISDVLSDAVCRIKDYQRNMPDFYDDIKEEIDHVVETMEKLRIKLDTPPED